MEESKIKGTYIIVCIIKKDLIYNKILQKEG